MSREDNLHYELMVVLLQHLVIWIKKYQGNLSDFTNVQDAIGQNTEALVDVLLVKIRKIDQVPIDLKKTFEVLKSTRQSLNP